MHHQFGLGRLTQVWIRIVAVVIDAQFSQVRQQLNQLQATLVKATTDVGLRDVMAAFAHPGPDACQVLLRAGQPHVPDAHFDAGQSGLFEQARKALPAQGGFKLWSSRWAMAC